MKSETRKLRFHNDRKSKDSKPIDRLYTWAHRRKTDLFHLAICSLLHEEDRRVRMQSRIPKLTLENCNTPRSLYVMLYTIEFREDRQRFRRTPHGRY